MKRSLDVLSREFGILREHVGESVANQLSLAHAAASGASEQPGSGRRKAQTAYDEEYLR